MYSWEVQFFNGFFCCGTAATKEEAKEKAYVNADIGCTIMITDPDGYQTIEEVA